jgi:hypothetical protein
MVFCVELQQRRLQRAHRHGAHLLAMRDAVLRALRPRGLDLPAQGARRPAPYKSQPSSRASPGASVTIQRRRACAAPSSATLAPSCTCQFALRGIAHREAGAEGGRPRAPGGRPDISIRSCVLRISAAPVPNRPAPPLATATMRKLRQRIVERHLHARLAVRVQHHLALPEQQGVEQFAAGATSAAAAVGHRLAAEVALADHLHLRGRAVSTCRLRSPIIASSSFQLVVGHQFQQAGVDRGQRHLGARGQRLAVGARDLERTWPARAPCRPACRSGVTPTFSACGAQPTLHRRDAELVGRLAQVDQRGRLHTGTRPRTTSAETNTFGA